MLEFDDGEYFMLTINLIPRIGKWQEVSVYFFHLGFPVPFHTPTTLSGGHTLGDAARTLPLTPVTGC